MIQIAWPTLKKKVNAQIWRVLDLSGLTTSVRQSRNYLKSGYVYLNGMLISSEKATVPTGALFHLEVRFPNGRVKGEDIMLVPSNRLANRTPRQASPGVSYSISPDKLNYRG